MKIYTKTGDDGYTILNGERLTKDHPIIRTMGPLDECNGFIGLALSTLPTEEHFHEINKQLKAVQQTLSDLCAAIVKKKKFSSQHTKKLENWIDDYAPQLIPVEPFVLPRGHQSAVNMHMARTACRKAERRVCPMFRDKLLSQEIMTFLNRLSDYLYVVALEINRRINLRSH
ncbi:MAG: cob(I)yrinic acid a,c-diamide adenosyltransferase [Chlamydiota bacterium]